MAEGPDTDVPLPGTQFAQFGAGCFWGVELAFQRIPGVMKTEVGYSQGVVDNPTYENVCSGITKHAEIVRVQFDPNSCAYGDLLTAFWRRHDPTTINRQVRFRFILKEKTPQLCKLIDWDYHRVTTSGHNTDPESTTTRLSRREKQGKLWRNIRG